MTASIQVRELGKAYDIFAKPMDALKEVLLRRSYHETFWALRDVNITLDRGASLGVVGENGAGKTTLLQLLAGTIAPTCGTVECTGRTSAILELGSGFHPDLTGVENIRLGCAMYGISRAETERRLPGIIAFSELERFIHREVRTYSSGMYARLAFAVASSVDPDIMVVDEALSVGDQHFRKKCVDRMMVFLEQGNTLVFCTHALYFIQQLCDQCLWLRDGRPEMLDATAKVVEEYQNYERSRTSAMAAGAEPSVFAEGRRFGGATHLREVTVGGDCHDGRIETGQTLQVRVIARVAPEAEDEGVSIGIAIVRNDMLRCYGVSTAMDDVVLHALPDGEYGVTFVVESLPFLSGQYSLQVALFDAMGVHIYDLWDSVAPFRVSQTTKETGLVRVSHRWEPP